MEARLADISVLQIDPKTGVISLGLGRGTKSVSGITLLAQIVALEFLKNPGRDVFDPESGSGLRSAIGQYNLSNADEIRILVIQKARAVEKSVMASQAAGIGAPSENLKKLDIIDVAVDEINAKVLIRVQVTNETGEVTDILI